MKNTTMDNDIAKCFYLLVNSRILAHNIFDPINKKLCTGHPKWEPSLAVVQPSIGHHASKAPRQLILSDYSRLLVLQKCQWGSVARRLRQMPSILLQGDNNQLPLLQGDTAHTNFFYFSFKGTHTNYLYYSFKGTRRAHTLTFSTSLQWGTHQTTSMSTILPVLILLLLLFLSL